MTTNQQNRDDWRKLFSEFIYYCRASRTWCFKVDASTQVIEEFIRSTRQSAAKEAREDTINKIGEFIELHNTFNKQEMIDYLNWLKQLTTK